MKRLLHLAWAAVAVLLLATACNKPTPQTTEYVTDSHGRRLVSKIEVLKNEYVSGVTYEFLYDGQRISQIKLSMENFEEDFFYEYENSKIICTIVQTEDRSKDTIKKVVYTLDDAGNIISMDDPAYTFEYDKSNHLLSIKDANNVEVYSYLWKDNNAIVVDNDTITYIERKANHTNLSFGEKGILSNLSNIVYHPEGLYSNFSTGFTKSYTYMAGTTPVTVEYDYDYYSEGIVSRFRQIESDGNRQEFVDAKVFYLKK